MSMDLTAKIPNNVNLAENRRLLRALESWHPRYLEWWGQLGPVAYQDHDVYLRTAVGVDTEGWANYEWVRMPEYRWGIFLAEAEADRQVGFGDAAGRPAWQEVPGEIRNELRRLIVVQGDTEPASVEQQRHLGLTCPSLYDLRNLFQVNVEEGRHLWAMVYLLHAYFGADGRDEADSLLDRHSGDPDRPRLLNAFNEQTPDWLSFFMFTYFTDRDGKFQLAAFSESGFDPLARTCRFMLKEEAYHMFTGASGIGRVVQRTCDLMRAHDTADVRPFGGINLSTLQKYVNFHYSVSLDLFGSETSTNAANAFSSGLKGRFKESERTDDHSLVDGIYLVPQVVEGRLTTVEVPARTALNEALRDDYVAECAHGLNRWNTMIRRAGIDFELALPHRGFHRTIGTYSASHISPGGRLIGKEEWEAKQAQWLPTDEDRTFVKSIMQGVTERGQMAGWIAPPSSGVHNQPLDYQYVRP